MKEYYRMLPNPDTEILEKIKVEEYSFQDWVEGRIKTSMQRGIHQIHDLNTGAKYYVYFYIPIDVLENILAESEKLYWEKVKKGFEADKSRFSYALSQSVNKPYLIKHEIESYEKLLFPDKFPLDNQSGAFPLKNDYDLPYNGETISQIRSCYRQINKGLRDYKLTNSEASNSSQDHLYITVEVIAKYYEWLKGVAENYRNEELPSISKTSADRGSEDDAQMGGKGDTKNQDDVTLSKESACLEGLFVNPQQIEACVQLLRDTDPPTINEGYQYIGNNKSIIIVWFNSLAYKKFFKNSLRNDDQKAHLLNCRFKNLNVSGALFRSVSKRATEKYKKHFETELSSIKTTGLPNLL